MLVHKKHCITYIKNITWQNAVFEASLWKCPPVGNGSGRPAVRQYCTHWTGVKCARVQACPCKRTVQLFTTGCPCNYFCNKVQNHTSPPRERPRDPTFPTITTKTNQHIAEATGATPILCQIASQVVFHLYEPTLPPHVITNETRWPTLWAGASADLKSHRLTETVAPNTATPAAIGEQQKKKNHA